MRSKQYTVHPLPTYAMPVQLHTNVKPQIHPLPTHLILEQPHTYAKQQYTDSAAPDIHFPTYIILVRGSEALFKRCNRVVPTDRVLVHIPHMRVRDCIQCVRVSANVDIIYTFKYIHLHIYVCVCVCEQCGLATMEKAAM